MTGSAQEGSSSRASSRGRKRSFDEDEPEKNEDDAGHRRKRSRDSNSEEENANADVDVEIPSQPQKGEEVTRDIAVPKKKRSRDQLDKDESTVGASGEKADQNAAEETSTEKSEVEGQPEKKRHTDDAREKESVSVIKVWYG